MKRKKKKFEAKFDFNPIIIATCIAVPILLFGDPEAGGIIFGGTLGYSIRKYYKEKKFGKKIKFFEFMFG